MTLLEAVRAIARGELSCTDLLKECMAEYERRQSSLNAFIALDSDAVFQQARAADAALARGDAVGPLHGVPLACKDMFDRTGHLCSFGARIGQAVAPRETAVAVRRLENAGASIIGALNMSEYALGPTGHNVTFGHCRNPRNPARISGGSSSGAGVAVAAGMAYGALGSDTGGSVRIPASCCGIVGLKPTQGRISQQGALPLSHTLDCIGPIARTAGDCALLFEVLTSDDPASVRLDRVAKLDGCIPRTLRLAYPAQALAQHVSSDIRVALDAAARCFGALGAQVIETALPEIAHPHDLADIVLKAEAALCHYDNLRRHRDSYTPHVRRRIESGFLIAAPAYVSAMAQRRRYLETFLHDTLADADALVLPTIGIPLPTIEETDEARSGVQSDLIGRLTYWTRWINFLGVPSLSVPCGFDSNGMPIGMQLVGKPQHEWRLFEVAHLFQSRTTWHLDEAMPTGLVDAPPQKRA